MFSTTCACRTYRYLWTRYPWCLSPSFFQNTKIIFDRLKIYCLIYLLYKSHWVMSRKMQNKMKMIYFQSVKKNYVFCKKRGRDTKGILSTSTCGVLIYIQIKILMSMCQILKVFKILYLYNETWFMNCGFFCPFKTRFIEIIAAYWPTDKFSLWSLHAIISIIKQL